MRRIEWEVLGPKILQLAENAGAAIMRAFQESHRNDVLVGHKADDSPITLADIASHNIIVAGLCGLTPEIPVVSEEEVTSLVHRLPHGSFWLIDPLDGTKEFLARNNEFTVNIALIEDGEPVWGVVYAPALDLMYWGGRSFGAFRKAKDATVPIKVSIGVQPGRPFRVVASRSHLNAETSAFIKKLGIVELVQAGSSLKFCRIAEGNADVYPRLAPTCEWDTAAAQSVVEGANGHVFNIHGVRLRYGKPDVLNSSFIASSEPFSTLLKGLG
jgi:3'(2'), 5'-bisphosphate nucleotidase